MDTIGDLTTKPLSFKFWCQNLAEHNRGRTFSYASPLWICFDLLVEKFYNLEHSRDNFVAVDVDLAFAQINLDLVVGKLCQRRLKVFIEILFKGLT